MLTNFDIIDSCKRLQIPLVGVFSKDLLPRSCRDGAYVINLQDSDDGPGSHWTAFYVRKDGSAEYFDSFGAPPPRSVIRFLASKDLAFNRQEIQSLPSGVCGSYCLAFLYWVSRRGGTMRGFCRLFSDDTSDNRRILQAFLAPL